MANPDLPEEIMVEIFLRLPTKSVGRCRCLSKTWATNLCNHEFIRSYSAFKSRQENVLFLNYGGFLKNIALPVKDDNISRNVLPHMEWREFAGSCNGLVLLMNTEFDMFLVNPITLWHVAIPNRYLIVQNFTTFSYGFGYDTLTDDYKVLALSHHVTINEHMSCLESILDVYSVKTGSWKRITNSPAHTIYGAYNGAFLNGAIHWHSHSSAPGHPSKIIAFDLGSETFREIPYPTRAGDGKVSYRMLYVLEGCLSMVDKPNITGDNTIYIMKQYGQANSWTKFSMNLEGPRDIYEPLCFIGNKELMFVSYGSDVLVYNFEDETTKRIVANGYLADYASGVIFTESLVAPDKNA